MSVISLADVLAMPFGEYQAWLAFLNNHLQRLNVASKARVPRE